MIIPKEAIEKAIEGGWKYNGKKVRRVTLDDPTRAPETFTVEIGDNELEYCKYMMWQAIALDPSFWQSLGKALGWPEYEETGSWSYDGNEERDWTWRVRAHRFYDLILTGGDTDAFWKEILKTAL
jgi:hypothetical protein